MVAAVGFFGAGVAGALPATAGTSAPASVHPRRKPLLGFTPVDVSTADTIVVPEATLQRSDHPGARPSARVGRPGARTPPTPPPSRPSRSACTTTPTATSIGRDGNRRGLLVTNHEYTDNVLLFADGNAVMTQEKVDKAVAAHGVSIVEIALDRQGHWQVVDPRYARRVTAATPVKFSGPVAADHPALQSNNEPMGTVNTARTARRRGARTWPARRTSTATSGTASPFTPSTAQARYGIAANNGSGANRWHQGDQRWDIVANPNEANRFGWWSRSTCSSRTRSSSSSARRSGGSSTRVPRCGSPGGRVVVYTGDDQDGDYVYKYVSKAPWRLLRALAQPARPRHALRGQVQRRRQRYVAAAGPRHRAAHHGERLGRPGGRADPDSGRRPTPSEPHRLTVPSGSRCIRRPTRRLVMSPTNSTIAPAGGPNPRHPNPYGHIIRWHYRYGDTTRLDFEWDIFLLAGDPTKDPAVTVPDAQRFGSPDGLWFDPDGRLWIQTDISNSTINLGAYDRIGNNQMLVADPSTGEVRRFLVGPNGCEVTGIDLTPTGARCSSTSSTRARRPRRSEPRRRRTRARSATGRTSTPRVRRDRRGPQARRRHHRHLTSPRSPELFNSSPPGQHTKGAPVEQFRVRRRAGSIRVGRAGALAGDPMAARGDNKVPLQTPRMSQDQYGG